MTIPIPDRLTEILDGLQTRLEGGLRGNRAAVTHPGARGEASEEDWLRALNDLCELSAQNELRPQDVMRILVHCHAYGDAAKVSGLVAEYSGYIRKQIDLREEDEVGRLMAECEPHADKLAAMDVEIADARKRYNTIKGKDEKTKAATAISKAGKQREKVATKVAERDEHIAVPDHSAKFWLTVQSLCRETERAKQWLCSHHARLTVDLGSALDRVPRAGA